MSEYQAQTISECLTTWCPLPAGHRPPCNNQRRGVPEGALSVECAHPNVNRCENQEKHFHGLACDWGCYCEQGRNTSFLEAAAQRFGVMEYVYEVRSTVPLALFNGIGNAPVLTPSSIPHGLITEPGNPVTVTAGPQSMPATITAELKAKHIR